VVFSSPTFLFLFLPLVLAAYAIAPRRASNAVLLVASLAFYAWGVGTFVFLIVASTILDWALGFAIGRARAGSDPRRARLLVTASVVQNLALLGWFKYANFAFLQLDHVFRWFGEPGPSLAHIALPIGISFFTFEKISYTVDIGRGVVEPRRSLADMLLFVSLFPRSIAGPIVRFSELGPQLRDHPSRLDDVAAGALRFGHGLVKKVVVADAVAPVADAAFAAHGSALTTQTAWLGALAYAVQILFDFSGYSDMAIGLAQIMGFRLPENFDRPYSSVSITDFWRRWHMTLSRWFRDYVYIPLGGSRTTRARTLGNLVVVFVLCGLWHGAQWTFVVWGLYHGVLLLLERVTGLRGIDGPVRLVALRRALTFVLVTVGWVVFRAPSLSAAGSHLAALVPTHLGPLAPDVQRALSAQALIAGGIGLAIALTPRATTGAALLTRGTSRLAGSLRLVTAAALVPYAVVLAASGTFSPFLYFRF